MLTRRRSLAAVCFSLVFVASCGSNGQADSSASSGTSVAAESSAPVPSTESSTSTTSTTPEAPVYRLLSEEELTDAVLDVQDLPAGYSQDPSETDSTEKTFCDYEPPFAAEVQVRQDFIKGGGLSAELLSIGMRQYASASEAEAVFDALAEALESCTGETYQCTRLTYAPMSAPTVGDASLGVRINAEGTDLLQFFALVGPTLINTGGGGLMNASAEEVTSLLEAQVNAYQAAATQ